MVKHDIKFDAFMTTQLRSLKAQVNQAQSPMLNIFCYVLIFCFVKFRQKDEPYN